MIGPVHSDGRTAILEDRCHIEIGIGRAAKSVKDTRAAASYPLANIPLQRIHEVVTESLTLSVRGILGGPYAEHDRRCLRHYESILGTCEAET